MNKVKQNNLTIVTGANGFTGKFVCKELKREINGIHRTGSHNRNI